MLNHFTKHFTNYYNWVKIIEAVILSCYVLFLTISQNLQENTCAGVLFLKKNDGREKNIC